MTDPIPLRVRTARAGGTVIPSDAMRTRTAARRDIRRDISTSSFDADRRRP
jgi:hypothetical protein